ncbi:UNKNOWN [Stylonychia lemnae]|uniref:Uncharacterized protein n=1 Tax=Stylonychia lemnae TaxID=5949 RepID=A0A078B038_STYLE|nr:UNKNOWN [Stylonychia lemnae]|eukprot:CDW86403.1 UNKNOWN [Stylonychia lemnae]
MNTTYYRKRDENVLGGTFDSQSQKQTLSQFQASQFYQVPNNGTNSSGLNPRLSSAGNGANGGGQATSQMDTSQNNQSGCISNQDSMTFPIVKQEIDLLEICNNLNEGLLKNDDQSRRPNYKSHQNSFNNIAQTQNQGENSKRKIAGMGNFNLVKKEVKPLQQQSWDKISHDTNQVDLKLLQPKVNRKYQLSPVKMSQDRGFGIAGYMGIRKDRNQERASNPKHELANIKQEEFNSNESNKIIQVQSQVYSDDHKGGMSLRNQSNTQFNPNANKQNKKNQKAIGLQFANLACNLGSNDFFNTSSSEFMDSNLNNTMIDNNMIEDDIDMKENEENKNINYSADKVNQKKQYNKQEKTINLRNNKKRKGFEISNQTAANNGENSELEEGLSQQQIMISKGALKKRKLNNEFDAPQSRGISSVSSSFIVDKRKLLQTQELGYLSVNNNPTQNKKSGSGFNKPQAKGGNSIFINNNSQLSEFTLNSRKYKCQQAYQEFFQQQQTSSEYLIIKIKFKTRKHGISWLIGAISDFKIKDVSISSTLSKSSKLVRVMLPVTEFNAFDNSNKIRTLNKDRHSSISSCSLNNNSFVLDGLVIIENPKVLSFQLDDKQEGLSIRDECYTTVFGSRVIPYEQQHNTSNQNDIRNIMSELRNSQVSSMTV